MARLHTSLHTLFLSVLLASLILMAGQNSFHNKTISGVEITQVCLHYEASLLSKIQVTDQTFLTRMSLELTLHPLLEIVAGGLFQIARK